MTIAEKVRALIQGHAEDLATHDGVPVSTIHIHASAAQATAAVRQAVDYLSGTSAATSGERKAGPAPTAAKKAAARKGK